MMNFELVDNLFQTAALSCGAAAALMQTVRHRDRRCLMLALAYACFAMGTLFWVLYIAILGDAPSVFYVPDVSWMAAHLFYLSIQIARTEKMKITLSCPAALSTVVVVAAAVLFRFMGPSRLVTAVFTITIGAMMYLSVFRLRNGAKNRALDGCFALCAVLQITLYAVSAFLTDFTRFNLYFAVDLLLTGAMLALLPLLMREVKKA